MSEKKRQQEKAPEEPKETIQPEADLPFLSYSEVKLIEQSLYEIEVRERFDYEPTKQLRKIVSDSSAAISITNAFEILRQAIDNTAYSFLVPVLPRIESLIGDEFKTFSEKALDTLYSHLKRAEEMYERVNRIIETWILPQYDVEDEFFHSQKAKLAGDIFEFLLHGSSHKNFSQIE